MVRKLLIIQVLLLIALTIEAQGRQKKKTKAPDKEDLAKEAVNVPPFIKDIDSNTYKVVIIGNQVWMAENLKTKRLNDGTRIPFVPGDKLWLGQKKPALCWYNDGPFVNDSARYVSTYGFLYNWYAVNTGKLCPDGWHVPSGSEWEDMEEFLGIYSAGLKMKESGTLHWNSTTAEVTNESGFTALPGGLRSIDRNNPTAAPFHMAGEVVAWWSSSPVNNEVSTSFCIYAPIVSGISDEKNHLKLRRFDTIPKINGASIRCLKN